MPTATESNRSADINRPVTNRAGTLLGYRKKGATTDMTTVQPTTTTRYKKKRPARGRKPARGRSALTIQLDSEKPIPRF
jgi:hypothetical protein